MFSLFDKTEISQLEVESVQGRLNTGHTSGGEIALHTAPLQNTHKVWQTEQSTCINNTSLYPAPCQGEITSWPLPMSLWVEPDMGHLVMLKQGEIKLIPVFLFCNFF